MLPVGFEPTDEWARNNYGIGLAEWYQRNPGAKQLVESSMDPAGQAIQDAIFKLDEQYFSKIKDFNEKNPFKYDEVLAQEITKAGTRLDPYYKQLLSDYTRGIELSKSRSFEDRNRTLATINADIESYSSDTKKNLDDALEKTRQGFADIGNYFSGAQAKAVAKTGLDSGDTMQKYMTGKQEAKDTANLSYTRNIQDSDLKQKMFERQVGSYDATGKFIRGAESEAEVRSQAIPEVAARQAERQFALGQAAGPPPGANPNEYYLNLYSGLQ